MAKNTLPPGDSTVVELIFDTKVYKGLTSKSATIHTNDTTQGNLAIDFKVTIIPEPDTVSVVRCSPNQLNFPVTGGIQTVTVKNYGASAVRISSVGLARDGMKVSIDDEQLAPGAEGKISFAWGGGTLKQGIKHVATFATTDPSMPRFSISYVVAGTEPFPAEPAPVTITPTDQTPAAKHDHNQPESKGVNPIKSPESSEASAMPAANPLNAGPRVTSDPTADSAMNQVPSSPKWPLMKMPPLVPSNTGPQKVTTPTALGMNPPHGQPNHRCDISVGTPLNSPAPKSDKSKTEAVKQAPKPTSPVQKPDSTRK